MASPAEQFYNVKKRKKVEISLADCTKKVYKTKGGGPKESYALRAVDNDGTNLTRFVKKDDFFGMYKDLPLKD